MTTIAFDGVQLAVDRASWKGDYIWSPVTKLFEMILCPAACERFGLAQATPLLVWAAAGSAAEVPLIRAWIEHGGDLPPLDFSKTTSRGLALVPDTWTIYALTHLLTLEPYEGVPVADGGGHEIAMGAMLAGATAPEAIDLVASRSSWAAGGVDVYPKMVARNV